MSDVSSENKYRGKSWGILACAWIFIIGGLLSLVSTLKSLLVRPDFSKLTAEEFMQNYLSFPLIENYIPKEELVRRLNILQHDGFFESLDALLTSSPYWWGMGLSGFLSFTAVVLGAGLLKGREWARLGVIFLHLLFIPLTLLLTHAFCQTTVRIFGENYPHVLGLKGYLAKILIFEAIVLVIIIVPVVMYFEWRQVKNQFHSI